MSAPAPSPAPELYCYEAFSEEADRIRHYAEAAGVRIGLTPLTLQEAGHAAPPAPVISIRTQSILPPAWAPSLTGILSRSTGHDHLLAYRAALPNNTPCPALGYLPRYCVRAVAEQALLLTLSLLRRLPRQLAQFDRFQRDNLTGLELSGKTAAIFGVGNIGHEIHAIFGALGTTTIGVDPVHRHPDVAYASPADALARADIILCAMNLTPANRGYFTPDLLGTTTRRPILVNIARGEFTPALALETALDSGHLSGAALDVYNEESTLAPSLRSGDPAPLTDDNRALLRLRARPDVILTPHNAFNTREAVERKSSQSLETYLHFRQSGTFLWPV